MSPIDKILEKYKSMDQVQSLVQSLRQDRKTPILIEGWSGSQLAFILSSLFEMLDKHILIVAEHKEEAAYFFNDLESFDGVKPWFLPDSFKRPQNFAQLNSNQILQRTEVVNQISGSEKSALLVTYPEAIFELVVKPDYLKKTRLFINKEETLDPDTVIEILGEYGFERVDFVYEPGQYSIRGGIIDIFSYGNEWPYRIELFDDEVESIRTFDPASQRSIMDIARVSIIPNISTEVQSNQKTDILEVLGADTIICMLHPGLIKDSLEACQDQWQKFKENLLQLEDEEVQTMLRNNEHIDLTSFVNQLVDYPLILAKASQFFQMDYKVVSFDAEAQPQFQKNFNRLIDKLKANQDEGFQNYIFTENKKQIDRITNIFQDLQAEVKFQAVLAGIHQGFVDNDLKLACYTDHEIFQRYHRFKLRKGFTKDKAMSLKMLRELSPGDLVVHIDHGVGRFSGLEKIDINGQIQESVRLFYKDNDVLYVGINSLHKISKYSGKEGVSPRLNKLGSDAWSRLKRKTKRKVKDIAGELIKLYAQRMAEPGHAFPPDGYLQTELEASFIYEDTPDQEKATIDVKEDMQKAHPMDRLICGDVGFGKTEIALRAAFKSVIGGKQVAVLVPTTILALQHYKTFKDRLEPFAVTVDYINRFRSTKEKNQVYKNVKEGSIDILIGTTAILNKKNEFKDLGLLVIDEEQKFGVSAKEKLKSLKVNVDTLTLTATPIPRTLSFSLMAARDLSILKTPPPNRQAIHTEIRIFNNALIKDAIYYETNRGGQVFFVHNRVKSLPEITAMIKQMCPDLDVEMAHGQMESKDLEKRLIDFIDFKYDVLVCTNIIETGLDIPNANTIIINNAHQFGLSDLHQLRGRVGRSNKKAFCYLFCPPISTLTPEARKRLKTIEEFSDLGDGFNIAMRDLDIRGAGNLLGAEQSGFINEIGYITYQKILKEAVQELKENEFKDLFEEELENRTEFVDDVIIESDEMMLIPDAYVSNIQERLKLYTNLDGLENEEEIDAFRKELEDRFGKIPSEVEGLFDGLRLRWYCKKIGFERLSLKNRKLRCYFIGDPQAAFFETKHFQKVMKFLSTEGQKMDLRMKQKGNYLIVIKENILNMRTARLILEQIVEGIND